MSSVTLNRITMVLAFVGVFITGVLTVNHYSGRIPPCGAEPSTSCATVLTSKYAMLGPIPVALIGLIAYAFLAALSIVRAMKGVDNTRGLVTAGYIVAALGTLASLAFTYIAVAVLGATCYWCLASAVTMTLTLIAYALLAQTDVETDAKRPAMVFDGAMAAGLFCVALIASVSVGGQSASDVGVIRHVNKLKEVELVPTDAHFIGDPKAPITLVEFGDLLCPACRQSYSDVTDTVNASNGKIRGVFRHFPLQGKDDHKMSLPAANIAEIASDKGKFFEFVRAMYQHDITELQTMDAVLKVASSVGLDLNEIKKRIADENDPAFKRTVRDIGVADVLGLEQTPTFVLIVPGHDPEITSVSRLPKLMQREDIQAILKGAPVGQ